MLENKTMLVNKKRELLKHQQVFHNYQLSTKKVDGALLYNLFMSNYKSSSVDRGQGRQPIRKLRTSKAPTDHSNKKPTSNNEMYTTIHSVEKEEKSSASCLSSTIMINSADAQPSEQMKGYKKRELLKRTCMSGNHFYSNMYESMKMKLHKFQEERAQQRRSQNFKKKFRSSLSKMSSRNIGVQDFISMEVFSSETLYKGKIGKFSAESITVLTKNQRIYELEGNQKKEIASLTKIMTCIVCLFLAKKYDIDIEKKQVKVSRKAGMIPGTSANLKNGDLLTVKDLLYGMMLPSGNDAAYCLAQFFGKEIEENNKKIQDFKKTKRKQERSEEQQERRSSYSLFLDEMNSLAQHLQMKNTFFNNPHGLSDRRNKSCSNDIAQLCYYAMKNPKFRTIVRARQYEVKIYNGNQKMKRFQKWLNTNKLLSFQHCIGIKTGITPAAGPCMTACFKNEEQQNVIVVILNAKSKSSRFNEVKELYQWANSLLQ